ncbi:5'-methylthioadenosine/S-adenosylhomocysteine nucleosidase [Streptomyces acidiscabies]|uniref:5'-methylthioadenosine/S-adenosylhomocysteine nucleosidase n=1 Tax=Streptomyces acidiscabies TaxID=42234 RepID=A0AAP6BF81_9ACTN|nr:5'-methylthioadenosine/S-adenosylhomocysteine nucleosidase [Streptomyces acidiscabies]MBZ3915156.1 5'-methylthioadenosine/S-adenosylhomocysteine nucleosidase [Streptomyces acidiscabies]MDX2963659.1 5'-methylthioadenosine/S-adenosylhomocysteine nucleosidase [Streptomyces acidiscabies]MDX3021218.1 5'-methylthioadenosine/S-adenosylhomocysteine nucleosidase [Streptomyces acidiscabies]MDX3793529.1 5'-methylthioadenosine/S-adenosylhomocysteine nucleosidase [Streptomyces acidiscabies]
MPHTAVILTALPVEYDAVHPYLGEPTEITLPDGTRLEQGRLDGTDWTLAVAELGEGALTTAILAKQIITELHPEALLFVGVAGGLKDDLELGDVVVGTKVYAVQGGKITPEGHLERPESWHGSHALVQAARSALRDLSPEVRGHRKPIACGDVVLADQRSDFAARIRRSYNDAYAIEMEGSGASHAAHLSGQLDALVIRGISDFANPDKHKADASGSQKRAAEQAAKVAIAILRKHQPRTTQEGPKSGGHTYGGDHIDFSGGTFNGPVIGKQTGTP